MAAIAFPSSPTSGQIFTSSGSAWTWDGAAWRVIRKTNFTVTIVPTKIDFNGATLQEAKFFATPTSLTVDTNVIQGQYLGTATTKAIAYNAQTIAENITVSSVQNAYSAGPITVNSGYTVTVNSGGRWVVF